MMMIKMFLLMTCCHMVWAGFSFPTTIVDHCYTPPMDVSFSNCVTIPIKGFNIYNKMINNYPVPFVFHFTFEATGNVSWLWTTTDLCHRKDYNPYIRDLDHEYEFSSGTSD